MQRGRRPIPSTEFPLYIRASPKKTGERHYKHSLNVKPACASLGLAATLTRHTKFAADDA
jgi:hypothetical protein